MFSRPLKQQIKENDILIYMKGTPYEPQCGFSARTVQALIECDAQFSYVDVIENNDVRAALPSVSDWPTFPQLYVNKELIGGCDIVKDLYNNGELYYGDITLRSGIIVLDYKKKEVYAGRIVDTSGTLVQFPYFKQDINGTHKINLNKFFFNSPSESKPKSEKEESETTWTI